MLRVAWSPVYNHQLPDNHRFPMIKYDLIREQLLYEGTLSESNFFHPEKLEESIILQTHDPHYFQQLKDLTLPAKEVRRIGFPMSEALINREILIAGGTVTCCHYAMTFGVSFNVAGGTHHSYTDRGEGFCLLNDQAIAANYLLNKKLAKRILILDLDVHQGNGTAQIFHNQPNVFTLSIHGAKNYPFKKELSDYDVALDDGVEDAVYLSVLDHTIETVVDKFDPDFLFYQSGVDALAQDRLGRLSLSVDGLKRRDEKVFEYARNKNIPVVVCMGGGYSSKLSEVIEAHANTFRTARLIYD